MSIVLIQPELYQQLFANPKGKEVVQMPDWDEIDRRKTKEIN